MINWITDWRGCTTRPRWRGKSKIRIPFYPLGPVGGRVFRPQPVLPRLSSPCQVATPYGSFANPLTLRPVARVGEIENHAMTTVSAGKACCVLRCGTEGDLIEQQCFELIPTVPLVAVRLVTLRSSVARPPSTVRQPARSVRMQFSGTYRLRRRSRQPRLTSCGSPCVPPKRTQS